MILQCNKPTEWAYPWGVLNSSTRRYFNSCVRHFNLSMSRDGIKKSKGVSNASWGLCKRVSHLFHPVALRVQGGLWRRLKLRGNTSSGEFSMGLWFISLVLGSYKSFSARHLVGGRPMPFRSDSTSVFHFPDTQPFPEDCRRVVAFTGKLSWQFRYGVKA